MMSLSYDTDSMVLFFKGLANETRLSLLRALSKGPKSVSELSAELAYEQSRVSHNLTCLEFCGFVNSEKFGKRRIYSLNEETIGPLMEIVDKHIRQHGQNLLQCKILKR